MNEGVYMLLSDLQEWVYAFAAISAVCLVLTCIAAYWAWTRSCEANVRPFRKLLRLLTSMLPAVGMMGTLIGMYNAFKGAEFGGEMGVDAAMNDLMVNFSAAIATTVVGIILKVVYDIVIFFAVDVPLELWSTAEEPAATETEPVAAAPAANVEAPAIEPAAQVVEGEPDDGAEESR